MRLRALLAAVALALVLILIPRTAAADDCLSGATWAYCQTLDVWDFQYWWFHCNWPPCPGSQG